MDTETAEAVETIGNEIRGVEATLGAEIRRVESSIRAEIQHVEVSLRVEMHEIRDELPFREEFREGLTGTRRHAAVLTESLRDDIRIVADGLAAISAKLDARPG